MLATESVVIFFTLWISFAWGILFMFFNSVVQTFQANYGFSVFQTGLILLALSVGALIGTLVNPVADILYLRSAKYNKEKPGVPIPEARLYTAIPGSLLFAAGLFWYGQIPTHHESLYTHAKSTNTGTAGHPHLQPTGLSRPWAWAASASESTASTWAS